MKKIFLSLFVVILWVPLVTHGATGTTAVSELVEAIANLRSIIAQNEARISALESENSTLRSTLESRGLLSGSGQTPTYTLPFVPPNPSETNLMILGNQSPRFAGMIRRMQNEWEAVRVNYQFPRTALIGQYEFVETGAINAVFVDIIYSGGVLSGSYDAKLLYSYDSTSFERKLMGLFIFDPKSGRYITAKGSNPFTVGNRIKIKSPFLSGAGFSLPPIPVSSGTTAIPPPVASGGITTSGSTQPPVPSPQKPAVTMSDISQAYSEKRYLSTINLSNDYLAQNPATIELLTIRYRSYFIMSKYKESLAEIQKIHDTFPPLSKTVACDGSVIASYAKNTTLVTTYKTLCNGK